MSSIFLVVQLLSHVQLLAIPWTVARQTSLSFTISRNLVKPMHYIQNGDDKIYSLPDKIILKNEKASATALKTF